MEAASLFFKIIPAAAARITNTIGENSVSAEPRITSRQITNVGLSTTAFFQSLTTALKIRIQTQTRIPAKAFCTIARCAKFWINAAMTVIMIRKHGNGIAHLFL